MSLVMRLDMRLVMRLVPFHILVTLVQISSGTRYERDLIHSLFMNYSRDSRPVHDYRTPVNVSVQFIPEVIEDLNGHDQILTTYSWVSMAWVDAHLQWNQEEWDGIKYIVVNSEKVWTPDIIIRNSATNVYGDILNENHVFRVYITNEGQVFLWTVGPVKTSCSVDMTYFPFDNQACYIHMDSWTYSDDQVHLVNVSSIVHLGVYQEGGQWTLTDSEVHPVTSEFIVWGNETDKYSKVFFDLYLRRKPQYYIYNILIPSILLSLLVLLMFLLPADSGEKIGLGITILLSFFVLQLVIAESTPKSSDFVPILAIYITTAMGLTGLSLVAVVVVLCIQHQTPDKQVPGWIQRLIKPYKVKSEDRSDTEMIPTRPGPENTSNYRRTTAVDGDCLCDVDASGRNLRSEKCEVTSVDVQWKTQWEDVARRMDYVLFVIFSILTLVTAVALLGIYPLTNPEKATIKRRDISYNEI